MIKLIYTLGFVLGVAFYISLAGFTFIALFLIIIYAGGILVFLLFILLFLRGSRLKPQTPPLWWFYDYRFFIITWLLLTFGVYELSAISVINTQAIELILLNETSTLLLNYTVQTFAPISLSYYELIDYTIAWLTSSIHKFYFIIITQPDTIPLISIAQHWADLEHTKPQVKWDSLLIETGAIILFGITITTDKIYATYCFLTAPNLLLSLSLNSTYLKNLGIEIWLTYRFVTGIITQLYWYIINWSGGVLITLQQLPVLNTHNTLQQLNLPELTALTYFTTGIEVLLGIGLGLLFGVIGGNVFLKK